MLKYISRSLRHLLQNPALFVRKLLCKLRLRLVRVPDGIVQADVRGYRIDVVPSRNDWWKSIYLGCCDVEVTNALERYLRPGGVFADVGAGVGYFSAIASDIVGPGGRVYSFDPSPNSIRAITRMLESRPGTNIVFNGFALGESEGEERYGVQKEERHSVISMVSGVLEHVDEEIRVRTRRLDAYLAEMRVEDVSLIKIDVEGYEYPVLKGLSGFFEKTACRPPIICEILLPVYRKGAVSLNELADYMASHGYAARDIWNPKDKVCLQKLEQNADVIFLAER